MSIERFFGRSFECGQIHPESSGHADERGSAQVHILNRACHFIHGVQIFDYQAVRQETLIDER